MTKQSHKHLDSLYRSVAAGMTAPDLENLARPADLRLADEEIFSSVFSLENLARPRTWG
jgi:hypothetical protein